MKHSGVYCWKNKQTGDCYIGSSSDLGHRRSHHRYYLSVGKHHNPHLQAAWNKYGEGAFEWSILEKCPEDQLFEREQHHVDKLKPAYNCRAVVESNRGRHWTDEMKKGHSAKLKEAWKTRSRNPELFRRSISDAGRESLRAWRLGKGLPDTAIQKLKERYKGKQIGKLTQASIEKMKATKRANGAARRALKPVKPKLTKEEIGARISAAKKGKPGHPLSEAAKAHLRTLYPKGKPVADNKRDKSG